MDSTGSAPDENKTGSNDTKLLTKRRRRMRKRIFGRSARKNTHAHPEAKQREEDEQAERDRAISLADYYVADYANLQHEIVRYPYRDEIRMRLNGHAIEFTNATEIYRNSTVKTKRTFERGIIKSKMVGESYRQKFLFSPARQENTDPGAEESGDHGVGHPVDTGKPGGVCFYSDKVHGYITDSFDTLLNDVKHTDTSCIPVEKGGRLYIIDDDALIAITANLKLTYHTAGVKSLLPGSKSDFNNRYVETRKEARHGGFAWVTMPQCRKLEVAAGQSVVINPRYVIMAHLDAGTDLPTIEKALAVISSRKGFQKFQGKCTIYVHEPTIPSEVDKRVPRGPRGPQGPPGSSGNAWTAAVAVNALSS